MTAPRPDAARTLFVYWKIAAAALPTALARAREAQVALCRRHPGLETGLWCRDGADAVQATVMETYTLPGGLHAAAEAEIEASLSLALVGLGAGPRHVESFRPA